MSAITAQSQRVAAWWWGDDTCSYSDNIPEDIDTLEPPIRAVLLKWIDLALVPVVGTDARTDSIFQAYAFECDTGIRVSNGQFKGAMRLAGYEPLDVHNLSWKYHATTPCRCREECEPRLCREHVSQPDLAVLAILIAEAHR